MMDVLDCAGVSADTLDRISWNDWFACVPIERPPEPPEKKDVNPGDPGPPILVPVEPPDPRDDPKLPPSVRPSQLL